MIAINISVACSRFCLTLRFIHLSWQKKKKTPPTRHCFLFCFTGVARPHLYWLGLRKQKVTVQVLLQTKKKEKGNSNWGLNRFADVCREIMCGQVQRIPWVSRQLTMHHVFFEMLFYRRRLYIHIVALWLIKFYCMEMFYGPDCFKMWLCEGFPGLCHPHVTFCFFLFFC